MHGMHPDWRPPNNNASYKKHLGITMKKVIIGALVLALTACASTGNEQLRTESESTISQKLVEGKTTKAEVKKALGAPLKTSFTDSGLEVWNYEFSNVSLDAVSYIPVVNIFGGSASGKKKELVVMFDQNNIVKRYSMNESDVKQKTGIFNQ